MNAKDYLKRSFSAVFHEDKFVRTMVASFATAASLATGYGVAVYEEPSTTAAVPATAQQETVSRYLSEIQAFKAPEVAGAEGWSKLDMKMKTFSERLVLDEKLSEQDVSKIIADFKANTRFKSPQDLWMKDRKTEHGQDIIPRMNYLQDCRADVSLRNASNHATAVYACALDKEGTNSFLAFAPAAAGGLIGFLALIIGGTYLGSRWRDEFDMKKEREEREKRRKNAPPEEPVALPEPLAAAKPVQESVVEKPKPAPRFRLD